MSRWSSVVDDYLQIRRAMGYKLVQDGRMLHTFAAHLDAAGAEHITIDDAVAWASGFGQAGAAWRAGRLTIIRGFARYVEALDPATEVPPVGLLPEVKHWIVPHIYSDSQVAAIVAEAGRLKHPHRADTYQTLIGLLVVTGMRIGEIVRLDRGDVDLESGVLTIRNTKFGKSRDVPVHSTTIDALSAYAARRDRRRPAAKSPAFFTSSTGTRLLRDNVSTVFPTLVRAAGIDSAPGRRRPRAHDLRHTFAVRCLIDWHRDGADVRQRLPLLSTYLGHVDPANTYWYLTAVAELVELVAERLDARQSGER
jgi:integrase/recombinase XerD